MPADRKTASKPAGPKVVFDIKMPNYYFREQAVGDGRGERGGERSNVDRCLANLKF